MVKWICKHGRVISDTAQCAKHPRMRPYHAWRLWIRILPFALLVLIAKWRGSPNIWYQDEDIQIDWRKR